MPPSELRKDAREALAGKWGKAVCIILVYMAFSFVIGFIQGLVGEGSPLYTIIDLAFAIISIPLSFGLIISFMKLSRGEEVSVLDFLKEGFARFGKSWGIVLHTFLRMLLPIVCIILVAILLVFSIGFGIGSGRFVLTILVVALYIATIIYLVSRGLLYSLSYYIAYDNSELSSKECVLKSKEMMTGKRGKLFCLNFSFIGWYILAGFTLYIGLFWLLPYIQLANIAFYKYAKGETQSTEA